jgi:hypothetical protein
MLYDGVVRYIASISSRIRTVYGVYQVFIPGRELEEDRTVLALVHEAVKGRPLDDLQAWEGEFLGRQLNPKIEAAALTVNSKGCLFWTGLEMLLRVTTNDMIRFGDIYGWQSEQEHTENLDRLQREALEYSLMGCNLMPPNYGEG